MKEMTLSSSKKATCIIRGRNSKYNRDFYSLNSLHSFQIKANCTFHGKLAEIITFFQISVPT